MVGMGLALFNMAALTADGEFAIDSETGVGTKTTASFKLSHIDRMPLGDLPSTVVTLIGAAKSTDIVLKYAVDGREFVFDTRKIKKVLDGVDITESEIIVWLKEMMKENIMLINGG